MDCLGLAERSELQKLRLAEPFVDEALRQLDRILASQTFARVQRRAKTFLRFVVAKKLLGDADQIKEMTIAISVFHESAEFNPMESSKVRVAGSDLRRRIAAYYASKGRQDPIEIVIPPATYVPEIRDRRALIAVGAFENWHPKDDQRLLCLTLADEVAYLLNRARRVRALRVSKFERGPSAPRYILRGSVEHRGNILRLNISFADLSLGRIVYWRSLEGQRDDAFRLTREVAKALLRMVSERRDGR